MIMRVRREMRKKSREKPYLLKHIRQEEMEALINLLISVGEKLRPIVEEIPAVTRDAKDHYLIAYALVGECDYLVTGNPDVLVIEKIRKCKSSPPQTPKGSMSILCAPDTEKASRDHDSR
jgi:predicted nucleic acid-binding protein